MATATTAKKNAGAGNVSFELTDEELASVTATTRGRKAEPSVYAGEMAYAIEHPGVWGKVRLTETVKSPWVQAQLRKAAKQAGLDSKRVTVLNREDSKTKDNPNGFVAFRVILLSDED